MKTNPVAPTTDLTIGGVTYRLLFSMAAVALAEELTDRPLLTGLRQKDINTPTIRLVQHMLFASLLPNHPETTLDDAMALVTRKNFYEVWGVVLSSWTAGLAEPDPEKDVVDADPTESQLATVKAG